MHVSYDDKYFDGNDDDGEMWDDFIFRIYGPFSTNQIVLFCIYIFQWITKASSSSKHVK